MKKLFSALFALIFAASQAFAVNQLTTTSVGSNVSSLDAFALTYVTQAIDTASLTTYTFSSQSVGTDVTGSNKRYTVVVVAGDGNGSNRTYSSATICGVAATQVDATTTDSAIAAIIIADTSGLGTSCTIAVTFSAGISGAGIGIYKLINPTSSTATAHTCSITDVAGLITLSININSGGSALGVAVSSNGSANTWSWSGITEDFDVDYNTSDNYSGAHGGVAGTPTVITAQNSDTTPTDASGCSASWTP